MNKISRKVMIFGSENCIKRTCVLFYFTKYFQGKTLKQIWYVICKREKVISTLKCFVGRLNGRHRLDKPRC
jgi:hypothetical protein